MLNANNINEVKKEERCKLHSIVTDKEEIEIKHEKLITKAKEYMNSITDYKHDINHMYDY